MTFDFLKNDLFVTEIVLACFVEKNTGQKVHVNRPSHGFAYNVNGTMRYRFKDGTVLNVYENDIIYLPKGSDYCVETVSSGDCYAVNFQLNNVLSEKPFKVSVKSAAVLENFKRAQIYFKLHKSGYKEKCCKELYGIICYLKQNYYDRRCISKNQSEILKKAIDYISNRYTEENISLKDLSELCGVSEVYLRKIFKSEYNMSPVAYINHLRLEYANALLSSGECSVTDACFLSGFNNTSYFCRVYKQKFGFSPKLSKA